MEFSLPKRINNVDVPPIKCQGIKTKLVDFISANITWDGNGRWIEPFLGSGVVLFNIQPKRALVSDLNEYIIEFYKGIQSGKITALTVRQFLEHHGAKLRDKGEDYYYLMRDKFNQNGDPLYLLFLNRSCFNGMMRFNSNKEFNVPFCKKPNRFRKAYVTKIVNQVQNISDIMENKDWVFKSEPWQNIIQEADSNDFIYLDPPYIGRHTGYIQKWEQEDADELAKLTQRSPAGFALSMWLKNKYRKNLHINESWDNLIVRSYEHFYHVGGSENNRNKMIEGLILAPDFATEKDQNLKNGDSKTEQIKVFG